MLKLTTVYNPQKVSVMQVISQLKEKVERNKRKLQKQEMLIKMRERKARTRHLIELGGLIQKADIGHLPSDMLLGALLSLRKQLDQDPPITSIWQSIGSDAFEKEAKDKVGVILKFEAKPTVTLRQKIRSHGLKWNNLREEWYGYLKDLDDLKADLKDTKHSITKLTK